MAELLVLKRLLFGGPELFELHVHLGVVEDVALVPDFLGGFLDLLDLLDELLLVVDALVDFGVEAVVLFVQELLEVVQFVYGRVEGHLLQQVGRQLHVHNLLLKRVQFLTRLLLRLLRDDHELYLFVSHSYLL